MEHKLGVKLKHHVPDNAFVVYAPFVNRMMEQLEHDSNVRDAVHWVGKVQPHHKTTLDFTTLSTTGNDTSPIDGDPSSSALSVGLYAALVEKDVVSDEDCKEWEQELLATENGMNSIMIRRASSTKLAIHVANASHAQRVLEFLKGKEQIMWIETILPHEINNSGAKAIVQSGTDTSFDLANSAILYRNGITGRAQVVSVGDTGIDHDMCTSDAHDVRSLDCTGNAL